MTNHINPVIVSALDLEVHYGEQVILNKASLSVHQGDRIGLVGRNGAGKSTFLKIIAGAMTADSGEVAKKKDLSIGFLSQEFTLDETRSVYENIIDGAADVKKLLDMYDHIPYDHPDKHLLEERIILKDAWNLDKKIDMLISFVNAPAKDRSITNLSGGEKRRVALCRALVGNPDLLILDEPTNHLDTASIEWIESFLSQYKGTCIFVTHDRYFLDNIANRIVELSSGIFFSHTGNYTDYLINKTERIAIQESEEKKRQNFLKRELDWVMRGPRARRTKSKSRLEAYYEIAEKDSTTGELDVDLVIPDPEKLGNKVLVMKSVAMELGGKMLFEHFNFEFKAGDKIGVIGANGSGKTTLLKIMLGEISPVHGRIERGEKTEFNYVDQSRLILNDEQTVMQAVSDGTDVIRFGKHQMNIWTYLRRFLFTDDRINTLVKRLSGGERSRLTLAKILKNGGNFLLLDEPTNDLDLPTLRILEEALIEFSGCVVVVSHDRYFLNRICKGIIALEGNGRVYVSAGDYDYYLEKKKNREKDEPKTTAKDKKEDTRSRIKPRKLTYNEARELENIEVEILKAEGELKNIENIFSLPDFYIKYASQTKQLNEDIAALKTRIAELYERWEELEKIKEG